MTNYERWKQNLTLREAAELFDASSGLCEDCPARDKCDNPHKCYNTFKAWGEADETP